MSGCGLRQGAHGAGPRSKKRAAFDVKEAPRTSPSERAAAERTPTVGVNAPGSEPSREDVQRFVEDAVSLSYRKKYAR